MPVLQQCSALPRNPVIVPDDWGTNGMFIVFELSSNLLAARVGSDHSESPSASQHPIARRSEKSDERPL
jgi:hypothetical protein